MIIDGNAYKKEKNISTNVVDDDCIRSKQLSPKKEIHLFTPTSSRSERVLHIDDMDNSESMPKSASDFSPKKSRRRSQKERMQSLTTKSKSAFNKGSKKCSGLGSCGQSNKVQHETSLSVENRSSGQAIQLVVASTSQISSLFESTENSSSEAHKSQKSVVDAKVTVRREYRQLAQKFHQVKLNYGQLLNWW